MWYIESRRLFTTFDRRIKFLLRLHCFSRVHRNIKLHEDPQSVDNFLSFVDLSSTIAEACSFSVCFMQFEIVLHAHLDLHPETLIGFVDSVERRVITVIPFEMSMRGWQNLAGHSNVASYQNRRISRRPGQYRPMFHALYRKNRPNHRFYEAPSVSEDRRRIGSPLRSNLNPVQTTDLVVV